MRVLLLVLTVLSLGLPAQAQTADDATRSEQRARAAFERGRIHYENGEFVEAATEFQQAYELSGKADLLYNLYVAHRDANQQSQAAEALRGYLDKADVVENRAQLEARLDALESGIAKREAAAQAKAAEAEAQTAEPEPVADEAPVKAEPAPRWWLAPTIVMASGGALMLASIPTGAMAGSKAKELEDGCEGNVCDPNVVSPSTRDSGRTLAVVTDVLLFGGLATAAAGAVWMILTRPSEGENEARAEAHNRLRPGFACMPGACAGSLSMEF